MKPSKNDITSFFLKKLFVILCLISSSDLLLAQSTIIKNLVKDFGAKPNDNINDTKAFEKAAEYINLHKNNITLMIPKGTYLVGKHDLKYSNGINIFNLENCTNISIIGEIGTKISYINSLKFGTFDTVSKAKPTKLNDYNPSDATNNVFKKNDINTIVALSKNAMDIGNLIHLKFCSNIKILRLELYGNSDNFNFGGYWGIGSKPYERIHYGINFSNCKEVSIDSCKISYFGTDALYIGSNNYWPNEKLFVTNNIKISNSCFTRSGRNNFSLTGGYNFTITNCEFSYGATTKINTAPGAGVDIEPETNSIKNVRFSSCNIFGNGGCAITDGYNIDTNIVFKNCTISSSNTYAVYCGSVKSVYESCTISGMVLSQYSATEKQNGTKFINCNFNDAACKDGKCNYVYLVGITGKMQLFDNCSFTSKYLPLIYIEIKPNNSNEYIYFNNCTFNSTSSVKSVLGNNSSFLNYSIINNSIFKFNKNYPPNFTNAQNSSWKGVYFNGIKISDSKIN